MSLRRGLILFIVALLNLYCYEVCGDESSEEAYPNFEYTQIFKGVPALFEYLLSTLEEKPEILEKNDINMFKRTIELHDSTEKEEHKTDKRAVTTNHGTCRKEETKHKRNVGVETVDHRKPPSTVAYEYGNSFLQSSLDEDNDCKVDSKREVRNRVPVVPKNQKLKDKIRKRNVDKDSESYSKPGFKENEHVIWDSEQGYAGFQNLFGLDVQPEEIQQSVLKTEKLLEDYNEKRMRTK